MGDPILVAKMYMHQVTSVEGTEGKVQEELVMHAVTSGQGDVNKRWSRWTPAGQLQLTVTNPDAYGKVKPGYFKVLLVPCGEND